MRKEVKMFGVVAVLLFFSVFPVFYVISVLPKEMQGTVGVVYAIVVAVVLIFFRISHKKPLIED